MNEPKPTGPGKLIGGYATNNLTDREKEALFQAALEDQDLFNALAEEENLRELLNTPGARRELIDALAPQPTLWQRIGKWLATPMALGAIGAVATAAVVLVVVTKPTASRPQQETARVFLPPAAVPIPAEPVVPRNASPLQDRSARQEGQPGSQAVEPAPRMAQNTMETDAAKLSRSNTPAKDENERRKAESPVAPATPPAPAVMAVSPPPVAPNPMAREQSSVAVAEKPTQPVLAFDYAVVASGAQILPSEDGYAALMARNAAGTYSTIVASSRVRKGYTTTLRFPPGASGQSYQLVMTREAMAGRIETGTAGPAQRFAAGARMAKRSGSANAGERSEIAGDPAVNAQTPQSAATSGRAMADSSSAGRLSIVITAPPQPQ